MNDDVILASRFHGFDCYPKPDLHFDIITANIWIIKLQLESRILHLKEYTCVFNSLISMNRISSLCLLTMDRNFSTFPCTEKRTENRFTPKSESLLGEVMNVLCEKGICKVSSKCV